MCLAQRLPAVSGRGGGGASAVARAFALPHHARGTLADAPQQQADEHMQRAVPQRQRQQPRGGVLAERGQQCGQRRRLCAPLQDCTQASVQSQRAREGRAANAHASTSPSARPCRSSVACETPAPASHGRLKSRCRYADGRTSSCERGERRRRSPRSMDRPTARQTCILHEAKWPAWPCRRRTHKV
jgi:hypothetical protein